MDNRREELLIKLLEELGVNGEESQTIKQMQEKYDEAVSTKERITSEQPLLQEDINNAMNYQKDLESYRAELLELGKNYTNLISKLNLSFDYNVPALEAREAYDKQAELISEAAATKKENEKTLDAIKDTIEFTPAEIEKARGYREALKSEIESVLNGTTRYLDGSRIEPKLKDLKIFSDEEIVAILPAISYPDAMGFTELYNEFINGKSKKTSVGKIINEAMSQPEEEKPKKEEKPKESKPAKAKEPKEDKDDDIKIDDKLKVMAMEFTADEKQENEPEKKEVASKVEAPKKESNPVIKDRALADDELKNNFKVSDSDVALNENAHKITVGEITDIVNKLQEAHINPADVRLVDVVNGNVDTLIKNVQLLRKNNYNIDDMTIQKFGTTLAKTNPTKVEENLNLIHSCGLSLTKATGKVATDVLGRDPGSLFKAIKLVAETDIRFFQEHPENMTKKVSDIMARIKYCQQNGKEYYVNGNFARFIIDDKEWRDELDIDGVTKVIDRTSLSRPEACNQSLETMVSPELIKTLQESTSIDEFLKPFNENPEDKERYNRLTSLLAKVNKSTNPVVIEVGNSTFLTTLVYKRLEKAVDNKVSDSDENILLAALMYNTPNSLDVLNNVKIALDPNTRELR